MEKNSLFRIIVQLVVFVCVAVCLVLRHQSIFQETIICKQEFEFFVLEPISLSDTFTTHVKDLKNPLIKYGFPSYGELQFKVFILSFNRQHRNANWVMEHLTEKNLHKDERCQRKNLFFEDPTVEDQFRPNLSDYRNSGYSRGHLATAENYKYSPNAYRETFCLSNVSPQDITFNSGIWKKLEDRVTEFIKTHGSVYVCTGPLYLPNYSSIDDYVKQLSRKMKKKECQLKKRVYINGYEVIGNNKVSVPTHFFKVIVCEEKTGTKIMESYIIPNLPFKSTTDLAQFMVPREEIGKASGLLIFNKLPSSAFRCINREVVSSERQRNDEPREKTKDCCLDC